MLNENISTYFCNCFPDFWINLVKRQTPKCYYEDFMFYIGIVGIVLLGIKLWICNENMNNEKLIKIYQDTKKVCSDIKAPGSYKRTEPKIIKTFIPKNGIISVEPIDTVSALIKYYNQYRRVCLLNMASSKRKGGGVERGAMAQEECLFRCSNLYNISDEFYPLKSNEFIYTSWTTFIKDVNYDRIDPVMSDVITMPAINLNKKHVDNVEANDMVDNYENIMLYKINCMFDSATYHNCDTLILGAWGCGVFKNDPKVVAELFNKVLAEKRYMFDNIVFPIINDHNSVGNNYQIFLETIKTN